LNPNPLIKDHPTEPNIKSRKEKKKISSPVQYPPIETKKALELIKNQQRLFAIISLRGQQFKVSPNDVISMTRLKVSFFFFFTSTFFFPFFLKYEFLYDSWTNIQFFFFQGVGVGDVISLKDVMVVGGSDYSVVGRPLIKEHVEVIATVSEHFEAPPCIVFKKKRRKTYRRISIHTQLMTALNINQIKITCPP